VKGLMDFTSATLLVAAVFAITQGVKKALPKLAGAGLQLIVMLIGVATTFLVAFSDYGKTQVVSHIAMSNMNIASLILVGLLLGGGATLMNEVLGSISNIGQNQPTAADVSTTDTSKKAA
jgi:uncharacterized membrane protein